MGEEGHGWWHVAQPVVLPILRLAAPLVLRYAATWWLRRQRARQLSRRQYLISWAVAFAFRATRPKSRYGGR